MSDKTKILSVEHHRNGVGGDPFYVALFTDREAGEGTFLGIVPSHAVESGEPCPESGCYECYVVNVDMIGEHGVEFGANSWRGDHYFEAIRQAAFKGSADSLADAREAWRRGWRTFRVVKSLDDVQPNEIVCPASAEAGKRTTCAKCGLCNGAQPDDRRKSIVIVDHGPTAAKTH